MGSVPHETPRERRRVPPDGSEDQWSRGFFRATLESVCRLLIFWTRPFHLSAEEAEAWVRDELRGIAALETVERAELSRLASTSDRHPRPCDWMLEVHLADARVGVHAPALEDWVRDLRLLGMRPTMVRVDAVIRLNAGGE